MPDEEPQEPPLPDPEDDAAWDEHERDLQEDWDKRTAASVAHFQGCECARCLRRNTTHCSGG